MEISKKIGISFIGVLLLAVALLYFGNDPNGQLFFPKCPINTYLGIYCTGCGSQRAAHDLLHFEFANAFSHNALFIPAMLLLFYEAALWGLAIKKYSLVQKRYAPWAVLLLITIFTILRNINGEPFNYLAP
ncbi:MAG: DUF2752 domain-containing protein [Croceitalea sp.]|nr:DUF2752 domain-containing protein [Croceitalea sp.]NNL08022.1 DUF2752 domain-containing protein [Croceitalea sp.]